MAQSVVKNKNDGKTLLKTSVIYVCKNRVDTSINKLHNYRGYAGDVPGSRELYSTQDFLVSQVQELE